AGQTLSTTVVAVEDQYNNLETGDGTDVVSLAVTGGAPTLLGTTTGTVTGGLATFTTLSVRTVGTYTLTATSGSVTSGVSGSFTITAAASDHLVFTTSPANASAGQTLSTTVAAVEDQYGNLETGDGTDVVSLAGNGGSATLFGTTTGTVTGGLATFTTLSVQTVGTYTLTA